MSASAAKQKVIFSFVRNMAFITPSVNANTLAGTAPTENTVLSVDARRQADAVSGAITAVNAAGQTVTNYTGTVQLTGAGPNPVSVSFAASDGRIEIDAAGGELVYFAIPLRR